MTSDDFVQDVKQLHRTTIGGDQLSAGNVNESVVAFGRGAHAELYQYNYYYASTPSAETPYQVPNLPPRHVLRQAELAELNQTLLSPDFRGKRFAIYGMGGSGKSTLAIAFGHDQHVIDAFPDGILWVTLGPETNILSAQSSWASALGATLSELDDPDDRASRLRILLKNKAALLIIDDVWDTQHLSYLNVGGPDCVTLVTTRQFKVAQKVDLSRRITSMQSQEAIQLLESWDGKSTGNDNETLNALVRRLGNLPLAINLVGAQSQYGKSWKDILGLFQETLPDFQQLDLDDAKLRDESLLLTFSLSIEQLRRSEMTKSLPEYFAQLGVFAAGREAPFTLEAVSEVWQKSIPQSRNDLERLVRDALVEKDGETYHLHLLIGDYARILLNTQYSSHKLAAQKRHHDYYFRIASRSGIDWQPADQFLAQIRLAHSRVDPLDTKLLLVWPERTSLFLTRRGHWADYKNWAEMALNAAKKAGDKNLEGWAENWLGLFYDELNKPDEALLHFTSALDVFNGIERTYGIAVATGNIARIQEKKGDIKGAIVKYEESLRLYNSIGDWQGVAIVLNNLGLIKFYLGQNDDALRYFNDSLEKRQRVNDPGGEASTYFNIGQVYMKLENLEKAQDAFSNANDRYSLVGDEFGIARSLGRLGDISYQRGAIGMAKNYFEQCLLKWKELKVPTEEAIMLNNLGAIFYRQNELTLALEYFNQSIPIHQASGNLGQEAITTWNIGIIYRDRHEYKLAEGYLETALKLYSVLNGPETAEIGMQLEQVRAYLSN